MASMRPHVVAASIDALAVHDGIGTSKIDLLKDAVCRLFRRGHALLGNKALVVDAQNLTRANVANILGAHDIEGTRLGKRQPSRLP